MPVKKKNAILDIIHVRPVREFLPKGFADLIHSWNDVHKFGIFLNFLYGILYGLLKYKRRIKPA